MTNEEAIKQIDDVLSSDYHYDESLGYQLTSYDFEWLEKSKKALEKQIPKKPLNIEETKYKVSYKCPVCVTLHVNNWCGTEWKLPFCSICGQALDWSDTE